MLTAAQLDAIARVAERHALWILADEVYEDYGYDAAARVDRDAPARGAAHGDRVLVREELRAGGPARRLRARARAGRRGDQEARQPQRLQRAGRDAARGARRACTTGAPFLAAARDRYRSGARSRARAAVGAGGVSAGWRVPVGRFLAVVAGRLHAGARARRREGRAARAGQRVRRRVPSRSRGCASPASTRRGSTRASTASTPCSRHGDARSRDLRGGVSRGGDRRAIRRRACASRSARAVRGKTVIGLAIGKAALAMARGAGPSRAGSRHERRRRAWRAGWLARGARRASGRRRAQRRARRRGAVCSSRAARRRRRRARADLRRCVGARRACRATASSLDELVATDRRGDGERRVDPRAQSRCASALSAIKGGKLAARSQAPVVTLVVSDVIGDDPRVDRLGHRRCATMTRRRGHRADGELRRRGRTRDCARAAIAEPDPRAASPATSPIDRLAASAGVVVAWGEPTVVVPDGHGARRTRAAARARARTRASRHRSRGVRRRQRRHRRARRSAAGAFVDGSTWDAIAATDPARRARALRCRHRARRRRRAGDHRADRDQPRRRR